MEEEATIVVYFWRKILEEEEDSVLRIIWISNHYAVPVLDESMN